MGYPNPNESQRSDRAEDLDFCAGLHGWKFQKSNTFPHLKRHNCLKNRAQKAFQGQIESQLWEKPTNVFRLTVGTAWLFLELACHFPSSNFRT